jgi:hypothetical protein
MQEVPPDSADTLLLIVYQNPYKTAPGSQYPAAFSGTSAPPVIHFAGENAQTPQHAPRTANPNPAPAPRGSRLRPYPSRVLARPGPGRVPSLPRRPVWRCIPHTARANTPPQVIVTPSCARRVRRTRSSNHLHDPRLRRMPPLRPPSSPPIASTSRSAFESLKKRQPPSMAVPSAPDGQDIAKRIRG